MKLTFLGTRGGIKLRSRRHRYHSALLVEHGGTRIMIDCGADWLGKFRGIAPTAILLTHAHPDHAAGLAKGAPCCVYATLETLNLLRRYPIAELRQVEPRSLGTIGELKFQAIPVEHSVRAPAVGYRISAKGAYFFYVPDIAALPHATAALQGMEIDWPRANYRAASLVRSSGRSERHLHPLWLRDRGRTNAAA